MKSDLLAEVDDQLHAEHTTIIVFIVVYHLVQSWPTYHMKNVWINTNKDNKIKKWINLLRLSTVESLGFFSSVDVEAAIFWLVFMSYESRVSEWKDGETRELVVNSRTFFSELSEDSDWDWILLLTIYNSHKRWEREMKTNKRKKKSLKYLFIFLRTSQTESSKRSGEKNINNYNTLIEWHLKK